MRRKVGVRWATLFLAVPLGLLSACSTGGPDTLGAFVEDTRPDASRGVIAAAQGGKLVLCEGWGLADEARGVEFGCDTVVDVMSIIKQFTAAAVLKLQMLGMINITDPIGKYLDGVPADKQSITIQQLLTHTSGLADQLGDDYDPVTREELIVAAMDSPLQSEPGAAYAYLNLGYSLLAAIIETTSGAGYEQFLADHLFAPAHMTSTGYILPDWEAHDVAVEYDDYDAAHGTPLDHEWADDGPWWNLRGNGGLLSTARDMYRWHVALLGDDILDENAREQLFEPRVREEPEDSYYGYGWVITDYDNYPLAWHNGGNTHSYGELARTTDGRAMVFWTRACLLIDS